MLAVTLTDKEHGSGACDEQLVDAAIEPKNCGQCPFWKESDRTPGVGDCSQFDEKTIDWEIPGNLCLVLFWQFAQSSEPACELALS